MNKINLLIDKFVYWKDKQNPDTYWKGRFFVVAMFFIGIIAVSIMPIVYIQSAAAELPYAEPLTFASFVILVSVFFIYPRYGYRNLLVLLFGLTNGTASWIATYYNTGGLYAADMALSSIIIIFIFLITNKLIGIIITILTMLVYTYFYYAEVHEFHNFKADFLAQSAEAYLVMSITSFTFAAVIILLHEKSKDGYLLELRKSKKIIEDQKEEIVSSIAYAKRIQEAKLPKKGDIANGLPKHFIVYKPKDIVSGDFYFYHRKDSYIFIAAADCTGHGVPGALVSMVASEKLEDALNQSSDVAEILRLTNANMKQSLKQSNDLNATKDGMDIALCKIDLAKHSLTYAGANRPLWIIRKGKSDIEQIKANKVAIGGHTQDDQQFTKHEIKLNSEDRFYICSDGYADTFSGKTDKKLTTKKFKQLLIGIQEKSIYEQGNYLNSFIDDWISGIDPIDDILVIGVEI